MAIVRTVFQDAHSGESGWEGALATFEIPDAMLDDFRDNTIMFAGAFVDALWNDNQVPLLDDAQACDLVFECWVSTEPRNDELATLPWKDFNFRDDIAFDPQTWTLSDQSGHTSPVYCIET